MATNRETEDNAGEEVLSESTSETDRRIRVYDRNGDFVITVPAGCKITFGYFNPAAPGEGRDGVRYGPDNVARQTALRIYRTDKDQLACFLVVKGFRDLSIGLTRFVQKVTVERRFMDDGEGQEEWMGNRARELVATTEDDFT